MDDEIKDETKYELMVIIDSTLGAPAIKKKLETIKKLIDEQKGKIFFEDLCGDRDLRYTIKKKDRGYYAVLDFEGEEINLNELNHVLKLDNEILRHMIVRLPFAYKTKSLAEIEAEVKKAKAEAKKEEEKASGKKEKPAGALKAAAAPAPVGKAAVAEEKEKPEVADREEKEEVRIKGETEDAKDAKAEAEEEKEEVNESKEEKPEEKKTATLEEVDEKLKNIIDNPDLNF